MNNDEAYCRAVQICNMRGLHARASARFVTLAANFDAEIHVRKDNDVVVATSIMGLMMLVASKGDTLVLSGQGADAKMAIDALVQLVDDGFGEKE